MTLTTQTVGLTDEQAAEAYRRGYGNVQVDNTQKTAKDILKENIFTYFNLIFAILAVLLIAAGSFRSLTFLPVIVANTLIGIFQELRAKKVLDRLSVLNQPSARVLRSGKERTVPTERLVLHDLIILRPGSQIPADAEVIEGEASVNEALLTGEADEILKRPGSSLMSGSFVVSGACLARLTQVGADSYIARLTLKAKKLETTESSEMVRSINRIVVAAGILIIPIGITLFTQGILQGNTFSASVTSMVAALIGMIPEGLYLLVSITLAMSAMRLARDKVMLHNMKSIETLARVDVLCADKTGTITDNGMLVAEVVPAKETSEETLRQYETIAGLYIAALPDDNATMRAMEEYFPKTGRKRALSYQAFSSKYKYSAVQFEEGIFVLGAPEIVLQTDYALWKERVTAHAAKGLRVVVFGRLEGEQLPKDGLAGRHVTPLLFVLLQNPIRDNAKATFAYFAQQGVEIKVISGDHPLTVSEVAKRAGIRNAEQYVDATRLRSDADLQEASRKYTVFGRVTPEQKQRLVRALQRDGRTVAMTGDGVNDILAMKDADCSIAMAAGSDAAVQAAQVVLLDSDFSHMPKIVSEGRRDINNIGRSATLFLVKNIFSLLLSVFSIVNVMTYPLQPSQISLISAFNIGIPAFFLAMEPNNRRIQGRFLFKVLIKAMPAALTDFLAIAALVVFSVTFGVSEEDVSVAATFLLAIVGFIILFNISAPINRYRGGVIAGCAVGLAFTACVFNDLFAIRHISRECVMLFALFAIATEPFMRYLTKLFEWIERDQSRRRKKRV